MADAKKLAGHRTFGREHIEFARKNRKTLTKAEVLMWSRLRGRRDDGIRFRRQQPIGPFIVDFYCAEAKLVIEIDGESHHFNGVEDARRADWLRSEGFTVLRYLNEEVLRDDRSCWLGILRTAYEKIPRLATYMEELPEF